VGLIAHIMRAYVTEENKFFIGPAQPWVVGLETCYPKWPLMKTRATVSSTWASTLIIHRLQDKQSSDPWSSLHSVWPPGNFSSRKTETRLTSSVWQTNENGANTGNACGTLSFCNMQRTQEYFSLQLHLSPCLKPS
jgi:hypothetical protein